jgi:UDP-glucuronate 4-epimerase
MKYLVTGASGFIGFHLTAQLISEGHEVLGVDNFNDYYSPELKLLRAKELSNRFQVNVLDLDLYSKSSTADLVSEFQPDSIVHLAAQPGIRLPLSKSDYYIRNNIVAFSNIIETAVQNEIPNFLYASSSSVYGNSLQLPFSESEAGLKPISLYGSTKLCNEILAASYVANSHTRARGMRFFTVYGPWGRPDMAYLRLATSALTGSTFKLFGDGQVKRDFTYVGDIVEMISALNKELSTHSLGVSDVVNIGGGNPHSMSDLILGIEEKIGKSIDIKYEQSNKSDTNFTCADTTLLRQLTGFAPEVNLSEGIDQVLNWATNPVVSSRLREWTRSTF